MSPSQTSQRRQTSASSAYLFIAADLLERKGGERERTMDLADLSRVQHKDGI